MGFALEYCCSFLCVMVLLPALCYSDQDTFVSSRATFYGSPDCLGTPTGACGFGEYGRTVNGGQVSGVSRLYKNGTGCGACYQVRCKNPQYCTDDGVKLVVTDYGEGDNTDFILSVRAYTQLALPNMAVELLAYGVVDIEYRRIPCHYPGSNLIFKVHDQSRFPEYLASSYLVPRWHKRHHSRRIVAGRLPGMEGDAQGIWGSMGHVKPTNWCT
ncbi:hypothetical protein F0562_012840 [Nyssa sinensis]|uniref:Expansin-like EG45 domain-containing protein n=1 Tax=Nyssa sinensis TaxID=561372 RepID=A0A5J4ZYQ2_9ASTE|nr:hypothetical protein F0562_012840 [Nyssa sinensis]